MTLTRRTFVQAAAALASLEAPGRVFAADTVKIGYVSPQTGPLAPFGEADKWVIDQMKSAFKGGLAIGGKTYEVQILLKDSQSNPNRAGEVANDLILKDKVALMLTAGTPETANPVCDACELNQVPCVSSVVPWQPWFFGRKGDPAKGFDWTNHIFWGLEDVIANFTNGWNSVATNKKVGGLFPNDGDGNAWGDPNLGFPKPLAGMGYTLTDPGRFQNGTQDFSAQIAAFKSAGCDIVTGVVIPPDAKTFLTQARQQGYRPKVDHPRQGTPLSRRDRGARRSRRRPHHRGLVEPVASVHLLADEAERRARWRPPTRAAPRSSGRSRSASRMPSSRSPPMRLKRSKSTAAKDVRDAVAATNLQTVVGPVKWGGQGPFKNVSKTPLVLGQWGKGQQATRWSSRSSTTRRRRAIPVGGKMRLMA